MLILNVIMFKIFRQVKKGGSPGVVVMEGNSCSEGRGFKSQHHVYRIDIFPHLFVVKIVMFV